MLGHIEPCLGQRVELMLGHIELCAFGQRVEIT